MQGKIANILKVYVKTSKVESIPNTLSSFKLKNYKCVHTCLWFSEMIRCRSSANFRLENMQTCSEISRVLCSRVITPLDPKVAGSNPTTANFVIFQCSLIVLYSFYEFLTPIYVILNSLFDF